MNTTNAIEQLKKIKPFYATYLKYVSRVGKVGSIVINQGEKVIFAHSVFIESGKTESLFVSDLDADVISVFMHAYRADNVKQETIDEALCYALGDSGVLDIDPVYGQMTFGCDLEELCLEGEEIIRF